MKLIRADEDIPIFMKELLAVVLYLLLRRGFRSGYMCGGFLKSINLSLIILEDDSESSEVVLPG